MRQDGQRRICVYCSSSATTDAPFVEAASELGRLIAERNYTLVYGGTTQGLMEILLQAVHKRGGDSIGVVSSELHDRGLSSTQAKKLIIARNLRERKAIMESHADAFIALPGGFGTLDELFDVIANKMAVGHTKPIALLNTDRYYDLLLMFLSAVRTKQFASASSDSVYGVASHALASIAYIEDRWRSPG